MDRTARPRRSALVSEGARKTERPDTSRGQGQGAVGDVDVVAGRRGQLVGKIQERYGVAKDEAERQLADWQRKATGAWFTPDEDRT